MTSLGLSRVVELKPEGHAELEFLALPQHCHAMVQGGYITAWIDSAMARAVGAATAGALGCNTLEIKISFYEPVLEGQVVIAKGWVDRMGRTIAFLEGSLTSPDGNLLTKGSSTAKLADFSKRS